MTVAKRRATNGTSKDHTTFVRMCRTLHGGKRSNAIARHLGISSSRLRSLGAGLDEVLDFVGKTDGHLHDLLEDSRGRLRRDVALLAMLHFYLGGNVKAIIMLSARRQQDEAAIVLRHFVEVLTYALWADICSRFQESFDFVINVGERPAIRSRITLNWDDSSRPRTGVRQRLDKVGQVNDSVFTGREWYREYLSRASGCDLVLLFVLPTCAQCARESDLAPHVVPCKPYVPPLEVRKEDTHSRFRSDHKSRCAFCEALEPVVGHVWGKPDLEACRQMLANMMEEQDMRHVNSLTSVYSFLSAEYVHFSLGALDSEDSLELDIGNRKVRLDGLDGLVEVIRLASEILPTYFERLETAVAVSTKAGAQI